VSNATCVIRFPDGELRCAVYNGTSDVVSSRLYTVGETEQRWRDTDASNPLATHWPPSDWTEPDPDETVPVMLACNYGFGMIWRGRASKSYVHPDCRDPYGEACELDTFPTGPGTDLPVWWPWPIEEWDRRFAD
jgi:hypothetical protein